MKKIYTILSAVLITASVFAQAPEKMSYQAVVRDANNALVANTKVGIQINILQGSATGTAVYTETQTPTTNANGLVSIEIGGGADFSSIDWVNDIYFIKTETDPVFGTSAASGITGTDTTNWNNKLDSYTETDPIYSAKFDLTNASNGDLLKFEGTKFVKFTPNYLTSYTETQNLSEVLTQNNSARNTNITNLVDTVNDQDAATKAYVDEQILKLQLATGIKIKDYDGNIYSTVKIGTQIWMAENLKTTHYADGTAIPFVTDSTNWAANLGGNNTDDAYCYYNNDAGGEAATYGALYTYAAAKDACPTGWHLPTDDEWTELTNYIANDGHSGAEGTALKATSGWNSDGNGTDDYGFSALPGGLRYYSNGTFDFATHNGYWWSSTENFSGSNAYSRFLFYNHMLVYRLDGNKSYGFSVRCLRD